EIWRPRRSSIPSLGTVDGTCDTVITEKFCNDACVERFLTSKGGSVKKKTAKQLRTALSSRDNIGTGSFHFTLSFSLFPYRSIVEIIVLFSVTDLKHIND
ncbi:unnamed protein product, partial [Musa banksii]